jgi:hypothetical protein
MSRNIQDESHDSGVDILSDVSDSSEHLFSGYVSGEEVVPDLRAYPGPRRGGRGAVLITPCRGAALLGFWMLLGMAVVAFIWLGLVYVARGPCEDLGLATRMPRVCFFKKQTNWSWEVRHNVPYFSPEIPHVDVGEKNIDKFAPGQTFGLAKPQNRNGTAVWQVVGCWDSDTNEPAIFVVYRSCPATCYVNVTVRGPQGGRKTCSEC